MFDLNSDTFKHVLQGVRQVIVRHSKFDLTLELQQGVFGAPANVGEPVVLPEVRDEAGVLNSGDLCLVDLQNPELVSGFLPLHRGPGFSRF